MIQGQIKLVDKDQHKAIVRTEYDDLIVLRILDSERVDVGDTIVGWLDCQGENFVLDIDKEIGVRVYVENGRKLFVTPGQRSASRRSVQAHHSVRRVA